MNELPQVAEQSETQPNALPQAASRERRGVLASAQWLAGTLVIAIFAITFAVQAFQIPSESMENTLLIGDYLLVDKVHFGPQGIWGKVEPYSQIKRGDIVVFRYPVNPEQHFVKRVIGLPGDRIHLANRQVFVNGKPLRERYVIHRDPEHDDYRDDFPNGGNISADVDPNWWDHMRQFVNNGDLVVPRDRYFVMGDNRDQSLDSRYWGFVPRENIIGRPLIIYWSLNQPDQIDGIQSATEPVPVRLVHFIYTVGHLFREIRWNRTLRLVN
jgi:signal peptidase I